MMMLLLSLRRRCSLQFLVWLGGGVLILTKETQRGKRESEQNIKIRQNLVHRVGTSLAVDTKKHTAASPLALLSPRARESESKWVATTTGRG